MAINLYEEVPAVCENEDCENYKEFNLVDVEETKEDKDGMWYTVCRKCKRKIPIREGS